jgi:hypothetical protein
MVSMSALRSFDVVVAAVGFLVAGCGGAGAWNAGAKHATLVDPAR